jgi:hypothetical protein
MAAILIILETLSFAGALPNARQVVVRGGGSLASLLERATAAAEGPDGKLPPVAIVVDVTTNSASTEADLAGAIDAFGQKILRGRKGTDWGGRQRAITRGARQGELDAA